MTYTDNNFKNNTQGIIWSPWITTTSTVIILQSWADLFPDGSQKTYCTIEQLDNTSLLENKPVVKREIVEIVDRIWSNLTIWSRAVDPCPASGTATVQTQVSRDFAVGSIITISNPSIVYNNLQEWINEKLALNWLRNSMNANSFTCIDASWNEIIQDVWPAWGIVWSDWNKLVMIWTENGGTSETINYMFWENANIWDAICSWYYKQDTWWISLSFWITATQYVCQSFYWQSTDINWIKLYLKKVNTPSWGLKIEIQTDSSGSPSGSIVTNWTSAVLPAWDLTTSFVEKTFTFSSQPSITPKTKYWIVLKRTSSINNTNYFQVEKWTDASFTIWTFKYYNWSSYITNSSKFRLHINWYSLAFQTDTSKSEKLNFIWFSEVNALSDWNTYQINASRDTNQTWLNVWDDYFLSWKWNIATSGWKCIWTAETDKNILIKKEFNIENKTELTSPNDADLLNIKDVSVWYDKKLNLDDLIVYIKSKINISPVMMYNFSIEVWDWNNYNWSFNHTLWSVPSLITWTFKNVSAWNGSTCNWYWSNNGQYSVNTYWHEVQYSSSDSMPHYVINWRFLYSHFKTHSNGNVTSSALTITSVTTTTIYYSYVSNPNYSTHPTLSIILYP